MLSLNIIIREKNTREPIALILCLLPGLTLAGNPVASQGLDKLIAYAGIWKTEVDHLDTPFSKASHEVRTLKNNCWRSGGFFACNQIVDGDSKALVVFTYDAKADRYTSYPIPKR
jgi:hypothetical protein